MVTVIFVCLGNICRSPMAEAVFTKMVADAGLSAQIQVDSAGTGAWHVGERAHPGTRRTLQQHRLRYNGRSRQLQADDLQTDNSYIICMDQSNVATVEQKFGTHPQLHRLLDFAPTKRISDIPDPYYTNRFNEVYDLVTEGCNGLLAAIRKQHNL